MASMAERAKLAKERREDRERQETNAQGGTAVSIENINTETLIHAQDESIVKVVKGSGGGAGIKDDKQAPAQRLQKLTTLIHDETLSTGEFLHKVRETVLGYIREYGNDYHNHVKKIIITDFEEFALSVVEEVADINKQLEHMLQDKSQRYNIHKETVALVATNKLLNQIVSTGEDGA